MLFRLGRRHNNTKIAGELTKIRHIFVNSLSPFLGKVTKTQNGRKLPPYSKEQADIERNTCAYLIRTYVLYQNLLQTLIA